MKICCGTVSRGARHPVARVGGVGGETVARVDGVSGETVVRVGGVGGESADRDNLLRSCQQRSQISSCQGWWCGWRDCRDNLLLICQLSSQMSSCQGWWCGWRDCCQGLWCGWGDRDNLPGFVGVVGWGLREQLEI